MIATIEEAKAYLRIEDGAEDALIGGLIATATALCEQFTGQVLVRRTLAETVAADGEWRRLAATPVRSIASVQGLPLAGMPFALPVAGYAVDIDGRGDGWARVMPTAGATRAIVTFDAGLAVAADGLPPPLGQGIVRLVAHMHAHRDASDDDGPPAAVAALWRPWRRMRLR